MVMRNEGRAEGKTGRAPSASQTAGTEEEGDEKRQVTHRRH